MDILKSTEWESYLKAFPREGATLKLLQSALEQIQIGVERKVFIERDLEEIRELMESKLTPSELLQYLHENYMEESKPEGAAMQFHAASHGKTSQQTRPTIIPVNGRGHSLAGMVTSSRWFQDLYQKVGADDREILDLIGEELDKLVASPQTLSTIESVITECENPHEQIENLTNYVRLLRQQRTRPINDQPVRQTPPPQQPQRQPEPPEEEAEEEVEEESEESEPKKSIFLQPVPILERVPGLNRIPLVGFMGMIVVIVLIIVGVVAAVTLSPAQTYPTMSQNTTSPKPTQVRQAQPTAQPKAEVQPNSQPAVVAQPEVVQKTEVAKADPKALSELGSTCISGYQVVRRYPSPEAVGEKGYYNLNEMKAGTGVSSSIEDKTYLVGSVQGRSDVVVFQNKDGAYFVPSTYFPPQMDEKATCASLTEVPGFTAAYRRLEPSVGATSTMFDDVPWAPIAKVLLAVLVLALVIEASVKRSWIVLIFAIAWIVWAYFAPEGSGIHTFIGGLLGMIGVGIWANRYEVQRIVLRVISPQARNEEMKALFEDGNGAQRVLVLGNWSVASWWIGFTLFQEASKIQGSFLREALGSTNAIFALLIGVLVIFAFECFRRGKATDWIGYVIVLISTLVVGIITATVTGLWLYISVLSVGLVTVLGIVLVGMSDSDYIDRDKIPDLLTMYSLTAFSVVLLVSRALPEIMNWISNI